ncbi:MAG: PQQ-like beta-propeller repeat protein [Planctomycetia bacterium]|nr:PQQ-like beta-propeller repeat protein [Planctomycetia bacterium]
MDTTAALSADGSRRKRFTPRARLLTILGVGGFVLAIIRLAPLPIDNAIRFVASEVLLLLVGVLLFVWSLQFVFTTRRSRFAVVGTAVFCLGALGAAFRLDFGGDMQQRFERRFWIKQLQARFGYGPKAVIHEAKLATTALVFDRSIDDSLTFLGPGRNGIYTERHGKLARDWSKTPPREVWRKKVGEGCSSFAIAGKYGFTQEQTEDKASEQVTCYDLTDGKLQWVHSDSPGYDWILGGLGPRATPTFHKGKLYALGSAGLLNCFDAATGNVLWSHNIVAEYEAPTPQWGRSSSPLIVDTKAHGEIVVVSAGGDQGRSLVAYGIADGRPVWHAGDEPTGYATPQLVTLGGVPQIVIVNFQTVAGHDPETGAVLWKYTDWNGSQPKVPQTIVVDDRRVFISAGYTVGCRMLEVTKEPSGEWKVDELWKATTLKPKFMNPIARDGVVYGLDDGAFLVCVALSDGKLKWRSKRGADYGHGQVILVDDLLIVQSEKGDVALVEAEPNKFEELGRFTALPEGRTWNVPVLWGKYLLVRNNKEAACYELPTE